MRKFFQIMLILVVLLLAVGTTFFILDIVSLGEFREMLRKALLILAVFTVVGIAMNFLIRSRQS